MPILNCCGLIFRWTLCPKKIAIKTGLIIHQISLKKVRLNSFLYNKKGIRKILQNKKYEVKKTEQDYFLKDVDGDNFEDQFLYVDYGVDRDDLTSNNTKKNASLNKSSKKGMHIP